MVFCKVFGVRVFFGKPRRVQRGWDQPGSRAGDTRGVQSAQMSGNFWVFTPLGKGNLRYTGGAYTPHLYLILPYLPQFEEKKWHKWHLTFRALWE
jgi:hypothetical protein